MLYGRDAEVARIGELLAQARTGRSGALSVCGDAGVGKTALLEQAMDSADGMRLLYVACVESEAELPFAGLHLLLRSALPRLDVLPAPQAAALRGAFGLTDAPAADRFLTGLATLTLLSELTDGEPTLCVVDDAQHWLDQASATALLFAARRLDAEGIALIFGAREGSLVCGAVGLPVLRLRPLDQQASARLLAERAADLSPLIHGMNPYGAVSAFGSGLRALPEAATYGLVAEVATTGHDLKLTPGMTFSLEPNCAFGRRQARLGGTVVIGTDGPAELTPACTGFKGST